MFEWKLGFRRAVPQDFLVHFLSHGVYDLQPGVRDPDRMREEEEVARFLSQVMPNKAMADYLVDLVIFILSGRVREFFVVLVGFGANGKGVFLALLKRAFGPYFCAPDVSLFMGRGSKQHGAADPEMAKLRGAKVAVAQEPEPKDSFRVGTLKSLASADTVSARQLYKNPVEFVNTALPILACNLLPGFRDASDGFPRRARVVEFNFKFVENPTRANEKLLDKEWQRRAEAPAYGAALLRLAFQRLADWTSEHPGEEWDIIHPEEVLKATDSFRVENDPVGLFKEARIVESSNDYITQGEMFKEFQAWIRENMPGDNIAAATSMKELKASLCKHGVSVSKGTKSAIRNKEGYVGWRFAHSTEDAACSKRSRV